MATDTASQARGRTRQAAVAGMFYPDDPAQLRHMVESLLQAAGEPVTTTPPKAIIAPHAGYPFSGPVAARAYALLRPARQRIRRVILLGPAHRVYLRGLALPGVTHFSTPLGTVELDREALATLRDLPQVQELEEAHRQEHSLEVHLPFLQVCLDRFQLVPLVVGDAPAEQVAAALERLWGGDETLIVISSDLSHYHDYATATALDRQTAARIRDLELEAIGPQQACGCMPVRGLLHLLRQRQLGIDILDVRNSGDTAGPRDRVVGYGSFAVRGESGLNRRQRGHLHQVARASIHKGLQGQGPLQPDPSTYGDLLAARRACFVTLKLDGRLRGCIGSLQANLPLINSVADSAYKAAFEDPRFPPLLETELEAIDLHISVLSPGRRVEFSHEADLLEQLQPGVHGLIIAGRGGQATFLPSVWEDLPQPQEFLRRLKAKAGLHPEAVPEAAWVYTSESF